MVIVSAFETRQNSQGEDFSVIILEAEELEIVTSQNTGKQYAKVQRMSIPCTFSEETAKRMMGKQLPGEIQRRECEAYEYTSKQTGEVLTLTHSYAYNSNPSNLEEVIVGAPAF